MSRARHRRKAGTREARKEGPGRGSGTTRWPELILIQSALIVVILIIYAQVRDHGFIDLDDDLYVFENPMVLQGLTAEGWRWAFQTFHAGNWHPLTWISHMLDVELFGTGPRGPHLMNMWLHVLNSLLVFHLFRYATGTTWRSALVAALFAVHPLHVESVAWVSERKDVLSSFFGLLSLVCYLRFVRDGRRFRWYALAWASLGLGLMAKPMLVIIPFILLLLDLWPLARPGMASPGLRQLGRLVLEKVPMFLVAAAFAVITMIAQQSEGAVQTLTKFPLTIRLENVAVAYASYLGMMFWPKDLALLYPLPQDGYPLWQVALAIVLLIVITALVLVQRKRHPYLLFGWSWYIGTLVPVIGLIQVGLQSMADRYTYLPLLGIFVMLAWGSAEIVAHYRWPVRRAAGVIVCLLIVLIVRARDQTVLWRDSKTMFEHTLSCTEGNFTIECNYGFILMHEGRAEMALHRFHSALEVDPAHYGILLNTGTIHETLGRLDSAIVYYRRAIDADTAALEPRLKLSNALAQRGRDQEAIEVLQAAVGLDPRNASLRSNLGLLLFRVNEQDQALAHLSEAVRLDPHNAQALNNLGLIHASQGEYQLARARFEAALKVDPGYQSARTNLDNLERTSAQVLDTVQGP